MKVSEVKNASLYFGLPESASDLYKSEVANTITTSCRLFFALILPAVVRLLTADVQHQICFEYTLTIIAYNMRERYLAYEAKLEPPKSPDDAWKPYPVTSYQLWRVLSSVQHAQICS